MFSGINAVFCPAVFFFFHFPFLETGSGTGCYGEKETLSWRLGAPICMGALHPLVLRRKPNIKREAQSEDRGGNPWWSDAVLATMGKVRHSWCGMGNDTRFRKPSTMTVHWSFFNVDVPCFVGTTFGLHYKWQIFPPPPPPVTMAVPDFLVRLGTGWRLQSQKRSKSLLNVFSPKGPVLVASRFRPLALFVTSRHRAQRHMKLSQSRSLNLQSFCMSWSKIVPRCVKTVVTCLKRRKFYLVRRSDIMISGWVFFFTWFCMADKFPASGPIMNVWNDKWTCSEA